MPRYLTFDEKTASALRRQIPEEQVFEHGASGAVEYALGSDKTMVTVMPTGAQREAAVAVFRRPKPETKPAPTPQHAKITRAGDPASPVEPQRPAASAHPPVEAKKPVASVQPPAIQPPARKEASTRAGGVLGLRDEAVFEEDEPAPRKKQSWWRKLWPEDE